MKKIGIIGSGLGSEFFESVKLKDCDKPKDIIVIEYKKTITINGIEYERIPQKPKSTGKKSMIMAMMASFAYTNPYSGSSAPKPLPVSDIEAEFELIQHKKSKLSRSERDRVETAFYRLYRVVAK